MYTAEQMEELADLLDDDTRLERPYKPSDLGFRKLNGKRIQDATQDELLDHIAAVKIVMAQNDRDIAMLQRALQNARGAAR